MPKLKGNKPPPNALKYGVFAETIILPGEDPKEFEQLHRSLIQEWLPAGPAEHDAVLTLAKCMWRKRRIRHLKQAFSSEDAQKLNKLALRCTLTGENVEETLKQLSDKALGELEEMNERNDHNEFAYWFQAAEKFVLHLTSMDALRYELAIEDRIDSMIDRALRRLGQIKAMKEVMAFKGNVPKLARTARQTAASSTIAASS
jgi:hypothetical protein